MKKIIIIIGFISLALFFVTCTDSTKDKLTGIWCVDINDAMIVGNGWHNMSVNTFSLESDFSCQALFFYKPSNRRERYEIHGIWNYTIVEDTVFIIIDVPENPMSGRYKVDFYRDYDNKLLKMRLSNSSIEFTCSKALQSFDNISNW